MVVGIVAIIVIVLLIRRCVKERRNKVKSAQFGQAIPLEEFERGDTKQDNSSVEAEGDSNFIIANPEAT